MVNHGYGWAAGIWLVPSSFIEKRVPLKLRCHFRSAARVSSAGKSSEKTFREKTLGPWFFAFTSLRWGHWTDLQPGCDIPAITLKV